MPNAPAVIAKATITAFLDELERAATMAASDARRVVSLAQREGELVSGGGR
jgi:hypothetical protein